jgi:type IX secretion system PorP/SprF family membrane protein
MIKKITLSFFVIIGLSLNAQQDGYQTHFQFNEMSYNPSYAGKVDHKLCISSIWHQQYVGFKSDEIKDIQGYAVLGPQNIAPTTQFLNISTRGLFKDENTPGQLGIALNIINDKIGPQSFLLPKLSLAYYHHMGDGEISVGLSAGMMQKSLNGADLIALTVLQGLGPDPRVPPSIVKASKFDLGAGVHYFNESMGNLNIGIGATHLLPTKFDWAGGNFSSMSTHYYVNAGMDFPISDPDLVLQPNILIKYGAKLQVDANAILKINEQFWGGLSYRQGDNANFMIGFMQGDFKVGYAFDFVINGLKPGSRTTHELFIQYCIAIKFKQPKTRYLLNPRHMYDTKY